MDTTTTARSVLAIDHYRALRRRTVSAAFVARQRKDNFAGSHSRQLPRARLSLPITLHFDEWETDTSTVELSAGGFSFLSSNMPNQDGFHFTLQIKEALKLRGHARIVAAVPRGERFYICVRFVTLGDRDGILLEDSVIDSLLQADSVRGQS